VSNPARIVGDALADARRDEEIRRLRLRAPGGPICHTVIVGNAFDDSIVVPPLFVAAETHIATLSFVTMVGSCNFDVYIGQFFAAFLQTEAASTTFGSAAAAAHDPIPGGTPIYVSPWGTSPDCAGLAVGLVFDPAA
jgi:hypothetical protein